MLQRYAELHCVTNFSFLRGASHPEELVRTASKLGYRALAITDECSMAGVVRAHVAAKAIGFQLIVGAEFTLDDGLRLVLLARSMHGYGNLCELITLARRRSEKGEYQVTRADLVAGVEDCSALWLPGAVPVLADAQWLAVTFGEHAYTAVELLRGPDDKHYLKRLRAISESAGLTLVATGGVHMHVRRRAVLQDVLTATRLRKSVAECGSALHQNHERYLRPIGRLAKVYPADILFATYELAQQCRFSLDELKYEYPKEIVPDGSTPTAQLRKLTYEGAKVRYPWGIPNSVRQLVEHELTLIAELQYEPYFLTVEEIVRFAKDRGILCQGRGSAANSAVCYCLGITEVDPGRMKVLFERFISKERNEPPDIDVDFEHERREEVMQHIFEKYGRHRAAVVAAISTYRPKGAMRDVAKALGFSLQEVEQLTSVLMGWSTAEINDANLRNAGFDPENPHIQRLKELVGELMMFPRHLSQHSGGFVIDNRNLSRLVPIENARMPNRTVLQWDKDDLDALGLLKIDILALGMLTAIRKTLDLVNTYRGSTLRLQDIPAEDPKVYDMLCVGDSMGVFQVESRAQMAQLPKLKPRCFYDLVVEVAIVRPGPIQGGMVHPYLRRRAGKEAVDYPSEEIKSVLERTLGVAIFQEQVMQIAVVAAGFTPGEADQLRRAMAAWKRKGGLEPFREKLLKGMAERGYKEEFAENIFKMILGFGEYGFPESHAASFALLVYISAWLKCHEPAAFSAGLHNSQPLGFYSPYSLKQDAEAHGVRTLALDVNISDWPATLEKGDRGEPAVRLGFMQARGFKEASAKRILDARAIAPFQSPEDLARRAGLDKRDMSLLAMAGALANLTGHRRQALWQALDTERESSLLEGTKRLAPAPPLPLFTEGQEIIADFASISMSLGRHPLALLRDKFRQMKLKTLAEARGARHGQLVRTVGRVTHRQRPETASGVTFVTLEDETGTLNVIVWRNVADRQHKELMLANLMGVYGTVENDGATTHLIAGRLVDLSPLLGSLQLASRDFH